MISLLKKVFFLFPKKGAKYFWLRLGFALGVYGGFAGVCLIVSAILYYMTQVPDYRSLASYKPEVITKVYDSKGEVIAEYAKQRRIYTPIEDIPKEVVDSYLAAEDADFYKHNGFDVQGIIRAALINTFTSHKQGASTITQQVAKTFLLTNERTYTRKIKELILSRRIERAFSKDKILELYLNQIYLGHGAYGVAAAAMTYFNKDLSELSIGQRAMLAGLPKAPSSYDPIRHPRVARFRRDVVLMRMKSQGFITEEERVAAVAQGLELDPYQVPGKDFGAHFSEYIRRQIAETYSSKELYTGGLHVFTTLDKHTQIAAEEAVYKGLREYDRRHGYRGAIGKVNILMSWPKRLEKESEAWSEHEHIGVPVVVLAVNDEEGFAKIGLPSGEEAQIPYGALKWAISYITVDKQGPRIEKVSDVLNVGDIVLAKPLKDTPEGQGQTIAEDVYSLEQRPQAQASLVALDNRTGAVRAMVGGLGYGRGFNRAVQAKRQSGSAFKPFVYSLALENGYTPASIVLDAPVVLQTGEMDEKWKPHNYSEKVYGPSTLRRGLEKSRNLMTIRLSQKLGISNIINYARSFGLTADMQRDLSTALGSSSFDLLELTSAYSVFPNKGQHAKPYFIDHIEDATGSNLFSHTPRCYECMAGGQMAAANLAPQEMHVQTEEVTSPQIAYLMTSMLRGVVEHGTAWRLKSLDHPAGAKTGTTNDYIDAWLMGFTPDLAIGVWVGFDRPQTLGNHETGSKAAAPIWAYFAEEALKDTPVKNFEVPEGISFVRIDEDTGKLPNAQSKKKLVEAFISGTEPTEQAARSTTDTTEGNAPAIEVYGLY